MSEPTTSGRGQTGRIDKRTIFSLLGRAHTLEILKTILLDRDQPVRFGEFQDELGLSPNTLSRRLDELGEAGFLHRTQYDEIPPRVEYEATEMLDALRPIFCDLAGWMEEYGSTRADVSSERRESGSAQ